MHNSPPLSPRLTTTGQKGVCVVTGSIHFGVKNGNPQAPPKTKEIRISGLRPRQWYLEQLTGCLSSFGCCKHTIHNTPCLTNHGNAFLEFCKLGFQDLGPGSLSGGGPRFPRLRFLGGGLLTGPSHEGREKGALWGPLIRVTIHL